jgi:hypothetical protein
MMGRVIYGRGQNCSLRIPTILALLFLKSRALQGILMGQEDLSAFVALLLLFLCVSKIYCADEKTNTDFALSFGPTFTFIVCSPNFSWTAAIVYSPGGRFLIS